MIRLLYCRDALRASFHFFGLQIQIIRTSAGLQIPRNASNFLRQQAQKIASFCCRACACGAGAMPRYPPHYAPQCIALPAKKRGNILNGQQQGEQIAHSSGRRRTCSGSRSRSTRTGRCPGCS